MSRKENRKYEKVRWLFPLPGGRLRVRVGVAKHLMRAQSLQEDLILLSNVHGCRLFEPADSILRDCVGMGCVAEQTSRQISRPVVANIQENLRHKTVFDAEALDEALCHGWIDGQRKPFGAASYLVKFTPRRPKGVWSKVNTGRVARLHKLKKMNAGGLPAVAAAKETAVGRQPTTRRARPPFPGNFLKQLAKKGEIILRHTQQD